MFDLVTSGVEAFFDRRPDAKKLVRREPLVGVVDGTNRVFLIPHAPILYASALFRSVADPLTSLAYTSLDADGGEVILAVAPTGQVTYSATAVPVTVAQATLYAWAGFQLMERLWSRDFRLSSNASVYAQAVSSDSHIYVCTVDGTTPSDPVCGSLTFSTSPLELAFYGLCVEMAYLDSLMTGSAMRDLDIRERAGGIAVNAIRRPENLLKVRQAMQEDLLRAWRAAMDEYYPDGDHYIDMVDVIHTTYYDQNMHWQDGENDTTGSYPYFPYLGIW